MLSPAASGGTGRGEAPDSGVQEAIRRSTGAPAPPAGAPVPWSALLLDPRERVLPVGERTVDLRRVALLELRVHVGRLVGRDRAGQAGDRDGSCRERRDGPACLALLGPHLRGP